MKGSYFEQLIEQYLEHDGVHAGNITGATLTAHRGFYEEPAISKEDIFYYVYGLLHSPTYKETYKADLMKMLKKHGRTK